MRIEMLTSAADACGRSYAPGRVCELPDDDAERLIRAGFARAADGPAALVAALAAHGAGLLRTDATDPELVAAAKGAIPVADAVEDD